MRISVVGAVSEGLTELSAFDSALLSMGVGNKNLIILSSVIPPSSEVALTPPQLKETYGNRLYVVLSHHESSKPGDNVYAGLGWVLAEDGSGLFVEHHGSSEDEVRDLIFNSLKDMASKRGLSFGEIRYKIVGGQVKDKPLSAVVCAVYKEEDW